MNTFGIRPNKRAGQNFLTQPATAKRFVEHLTASTDYSEKTAIEIGPGLGAITKPLCAKFGHVIAIEKDRRILQFWSENEHTPDNLELLEGDATNFDFAKLSNRLGSKLIVFGNLPFNVSTQILQRLLVQWQFIDRAILTFQSEVARRILAKPGTKDYGSLTVFTQTYCRAREVMFIGKNQYYPVPKIDSRVVLFEFLEKPLVEVEALGAFEKFVHQLFLYRRKTLLNGLKLANNFATWREATMDYFQKNNLSLSTRVEVLGFHTLYDLFTYCKNWETKA